MDLLIAPRKVCSPYLRRVLLPRPWEREVREYKEFHAELLGRKKSGRRWADLTITATSVLIGTAAVYNGKFIAGETITAGQPVYYDSVAKQYFKAINTVALNGNNQTTWSVVGIALSGGAVGQPIHIQSAGQITIGATVTLATEYYLSANAGGICPLADVASGHQVFRIGYADTVSTLQLDMKNLGVHP